MVRDDVCTLVSAAEAGDTRKLKLAWDDPCSDGGHKIGCLWLAMISTTNKQDSTCARELLRHGATLPGISETFDLLLLIATKTNNLELVRALVKAGVLVDPTSTCTLQQAKDICLFAYILEIPGISAKGIGSLHGLDSLFEYCAFHEHDSFSCLTPLMVAAMEGHTQCLDYFIQVGANTDARDECGATPLMLAAVHGHSECVRSLLRAGCQVDARSAFYTPPLQWATKRGHHACVKILGRRNAKVSVNVSDDATALILASAKGHHKCVQELVKYSSHVDMRTQGLGRTALHEAAANGHDVIARLLLQAGACTKTADCEGKTALVHAATQHRFAVMKVILDHSPSDVALTSGCVKDLPLLHFFIQPYRVKPIQAIRLFLERGANVDQYDKNFSTPLLWLLGAPEEDKETSEVFKILLRHGANPNKAGRSRRLHILPGNPGFNSPLPLALIAGNPSLARMLWLAGSDVKECTDWLRYPERMESFRKQFGIFAPCRDIRTDELIRNEILELLGEIASNPRNLSEISRLCVRKTLCCNIPLKTVSLPLPTIIKDYINLPELDNI